ncbi:MAG: winged helix-turn-helix domain-containing protein [Planctomycetia bacterium]
MQGILDREFGKTFSLNGIYKLLNRHGLVCLKPRPRHPRQDPAAAKAFKRRAPFL